MKAWITIAVPGLTPMSRSSPSTAPRKVTSSMNAVPIALRTAPG